MPRCKQERKKENDSFDEEEPPQDVHELYIINVGVDENQKCRICLNVGEIPIFIGSVAVELCRSIFEIGGIEVSVDDPFPKFLCLSCHALLRSAILFRKTAQLTDRLLKSQRGESEPAAELNYHSDNDDAQDNTIAIEHVDYDHTYDNEPTNDQTYDSDHTYYSNTDEIHTDIEIKPETLSVSFYPDLPQNDNSLTDIDTSLEQNAEHQNDHTDTDKPETTSGHTDRRQTIVAKANNNTSLAKNAKIVIRQRFCKRCDLHFDTVKEYQAHITTPEHENKRIECKICNKSLSHHSYRKHPCVLPADKRKKKRNYKSRGRKRYCKRCDLHFSSYTEYRAHIVTPEHENKRVECKICKKTLSHNYFRKHPCERNPAYVPRITDVCDICGKEFKTKSLYKRHRTIHFPERPYECPYCPYRGRFDQALKVHIRTHTGERPYQCTHCPSRFINKGALNKHLLTLKGQRDFNCDSCGRGFYLKRDLELHIKVDHVGIKEFACEKCGKAFGYRHQMTKHFKKVHLKVKKKGTGGLVVVAPTSDPKVVGSNPLVYQ